MENNQYGFESQPTHPQDPQDPGLEVATGNWPLSMGSALQWDEFIDVHHPLLNVEDGEWPHLTTGSESNFPVDSSPTATNQGQFDTPAIDNSELFPFDEKEVENLPYERFGDVSQWLDGAYSPAEPCNYCRRHRLRCLIIRTAPANPNPITSCSSCVALFRECSLAKGEKREPSCFETIEPVFGGLHGLSELAEHAGGALENYQASDDIGERKESKRFLRKGARVLRDWFFQHSEYPYPTDEEKGWLSTETGFSKRRVSTWFANARRRQKQKEQTSEPSGRLFRSGSPMPSMTPMERWQASPPDEEGVPETAIQNAIASGESGFDSGSSFNNFDYLFEMEEVSPHFTSSAPSLGSRHSEDSYDSLSSAWSHSSGGRGLPIPSSLKRPRPRQRRGRPRRTAQEGQYKCTFCPQSFQKKHDWCRHEKSVHLSLESWICTPDLETLQPSTLIPSECRFCEIQHPSNTHWEDHEFHVCADKPVSERTFSRKDYLWQHLKKFHGCTKLPVSGLELWCCDNNATVSRCGFCSQVLPTWSSRMDHLAGHFKQGSRMKQWVGDWGLESSVLARLRNACLPSERSSLAGHGDPS